MMIKILKDVWNATDYKLTLFLIIFGISFIIWFLFFLFIDMLFGIE